MEGPAVSESSQNRAATEAMAKSGLDDRLAEYEGPTEIFDAGGPMSVDTLFDALAHPGRRYVLTYLLLREEFVSLTELVDFVIRATESVRTRATFREQIVEELVRTHLPHLDDAGLVEYRMERQFVGPTDRTVLALPYLDLALEQATGDNEE